MSRRIQVAISSSSLSLSPAPSGGEGGIVGRNLEDRPEDHLCLHAVSVHVGETQLQDGRTARALVVDSGTVEGVVERLDRAHRACRGRLAVPSAPDLAVADPHRLSVALLDVRRAVEQRSRKPRCPQIRGQLAEVHVIVAGDEPSHVILCSMRALRGRAARRSSSSCLFARRDDQSTAAPGARAGRDADPRPRAQPPALGAGTSARAARGGRKVSAIATAPSPMPNEPM
jgi:hypothetical protein